MGIIPERTEEEQAAHDEVLSSAFGETPLHLALAKSAAENKQPTAISQLTKVELTYLEAKIADSVQGNGMYGHGTGAGLGGEAHKESIATQIIAAREPAVTAAQKSEDDRAEYASRYGSYFSAAKPSGA